MWRFERVWVFAVLVMVLGTHAIRAELPAHIMKTAQWDERASLPHDGWAAFQGSDNHLYAVRLKNGSPEKVSSGVEIRLPSFSPDGSWIYGSDERDGTLKIIKTEGNSPSQWPVYDLGITASWHSCWYYNSPYEDVEQGIYEIAWANPKDAPEDGKRAYAQRIDLSGAEPTFVGDRRLIAHFHSSNKNWGDEFGVAGDLIIYDVGPGLIATIPNKGRGIADKSTVHFYGSYNTSDRMCSSNLSPSTKYWTSNVGGTLRGTFHDDTPDMEAPVNHEGCIYVKSKRVTDPKVTMYDWVTDPSKGAVASIFVPEEICMSSGTCINQRNLEDNTWFGWRFLNDEKFITGFHNPNNTQPNKGGYLLDVTDNTWYEIISPDERAGGMTAWFDGVPVAEWENRPSPVSISVQNPRYNARVEVGQSVPIQADVSSWADDIVSVTFSIVDGADLGTKQAAPYSATWTPSAAGSFQVRIVGKDARGFVDTTLIPVTVLNDLTPTLIDLSPSVISVAPNGSTRFTAVVFDQEGYALDIQPEIEWSVSGGGTIAGDGLFVAGDQGGGPYEVTATSGSVVGTAELMIEYAVIKIDFAGSSHYNRISEPWLVDTAAFFGDQGNGFTYGWVDSNNVDPSKGKTVGPSNCAFDIPSEVYTQLRMQDLAPGQILQSRSWRIRLPNGSYKVTIQSGEMERWQNHEIYRILGNGVLIIDDQADDCKIASGTAIVPVTEGLLTLSTPPGVYTENKISTIEIEAVNAKPDFGFVIYNPVANEEYTVGDTLHLLWEAAEDITEAVFECSPNMGVSWGKMVESTILREDPDGRWGHLKWVVPPTISSSEGDLNLVGKTVHIKVSQYTNNTGGTAAAESTVPITIVDATAVTESGAVSTGISRPSVRITGMQGLAVNLPEGEWRVKLFNPRGARVLVLRKSVTSRETCGLSTTGMSAGLYLVRVRSSNHMYQYRVTMTRTR